MLYQQRREEQRLPVGQQDVGVPRDNSLVVIVPLETKISVDAVQREIKREYQKKDFGVSKDITLEPDAVLRIHKCWCGSGSISLTNGSGCGSGSCYFLQ